MSGSNPREQRRVPRVNRSFMARYRVPVGGQANWLVSPLRDLSSGGARFLSEYPFQTGAFLEIALLLPASSQPIIVKAKIAWAKPWRAGLTEIGATFNISDDVIQQQLDAAVTHFLRGGGPRH